MKILPLNDMLVEMVRNKKFELSMIVLISSRILYKETEK